MSDNTIALEATVRTEFGKGAARRTRREGLVPAVLYGHGTEPIHLSLPGHETFMALKGNANAVLTVKFGKSSELALVKDVQRDPVKRIIEHIDLVIVKRGEKIVVDVPVVVEGESAPGTIHTIDAMVLSVQADALKLPEHIVVDIEGLEDGHIVRAGDVVLPKGVELEIDPELPVVNISTPRGEDEDEAAEAEAPAAETAEA